MRVLLVEDEPKVARAVERGLRAEGYDVTVAADGDAADALLRKGRFDLLVLDLMLPGRDGFALLEEARRRGDKLPVLVLTARDEVEDRVRGLDLGADDYLVKPFAFAELVARIRALLRRGTAEVLRLAAADLELDRVTRVVRRAGRVLDLTRREYEILEYLLRDPGRVVTREMLARDVWKETGRVTPLDNVIDVHMTRLRRKVDRGFARPLLHTVRGVGFVLEAR
jgi:DNA-binding response OmpR family regulator